MRPGIWQRNELLTPLLMVLVFWGAVLVVLGALSLAFGQPDIRHRAWRADIACSRVQPTRGHGLDEVVWKSFPHRSPLFQNGSILIGLWVPPDTIYIDDFYADTMWVVQHELLHQLLRGPPLELGGGAHPWYPFTFPCQLLPQQHGW